MPITELQSAGRLLRGEFNKEGIEELRGEMDKLIDEYWKKFVFQRDHCDYDEFGPGQFLKEQWKDLSSISKINRHTEPVEVSALLLRRTDKEGAGYRVNSNKLSSWLSYMKHQTNWEDLSYDQKRIYQKSLIISSRLTKVEDTPGDTDDSVALMMEVLENLGVPVDEKVQLGLYAVSHIGEALTIFRDEEELGRAYVESRQTNPFVHLVRANQLIKAMGKSGGE